MDLLITGRIEGDMYTPERASCRAFDYLKDFPHLPVVLRRGKGKEVYGRPSNAEIKRWLKDKAVVINGDTPTPDDYVSFPITELIFFPRSKRKTTMIREGSNDARLPISSL